MSDGGVSLGSLPVRQPPADLQMEQALLAALLMSNKAATTVGAFLRSKHFADPLHGRIYEAIARRVANGQLADALTVSAELRGDVALAEAGGAGYVASIILAFVGHGTAQPYAKVVRDLALRREVIAAAGQIAEDAYSGGEGESLIGDAVGKLLALAEGDGAYAGIDIGDAAAEAVRQAEAAFKGDGARVLTGLPSLDRLCGGFWPGHLIYLMARSRAGKSSVMLQVGRHVAGQLRAEAEVTGQVPGCVHIFSLEMTATDLAAVNLAAMTRWSVEDIRCGSIGASAGWVELDRARGRLADLPIVVDDAAGMDLTTLIMRARAVAQKRRTRLVLIDYRELVARPRENAKMSLPEWIPHLGYALKALAKAINVPVVGLTQINKSRDTADTTTPTLHDLPFDGGQAADLVLALHRPELHLPADAPVLLGKTAAQRAAADDMWRADRQRVAGLAEVHALKRRFGPTGVCQLRWDGPRMTLRELGDER